MASATQVSLSGNTIVNGVLWDGWKWSSSTLSYYFANDHVTWEVHEKTAYEQAIQQWAAVSGLQFSESANRAGADFVELQADGNQMNSIYGQGSTTFGFHESPDPTYISIANSSQNANIGTNELNGVYNWQLMGMNPWTAGSLGPGGFTFRMIVHELGHALGLKHPHDVLGSAPTLPGVTSNNDLGDNNLAHMFSTVMAYNRGYTFDANGLIVALNTNNIVIGSSDILDYGYAAGPMALDIATIQYLYGASSANTGDDTYYLPVNNVAGEAMWRCLWDTGGTDTMYYGGTQGVIISLHAATLDNTVEGGGTLSYARNTYGGFTIANGVDIENATGGSGDDQIIGNNLNNSLQGQAGADMLYGELGNDTLDGGTQDAASDTLTGGYGADYLYGHLGDDALYGDYKDNYGEGGDDQIYGGGGKDEIQGAGGNDYLYGDGGTDENYLTGDDNDSIHGGTGDDHIWAGGQDDTVYGGTGADSLYGGHGNDIVRGENEADFIDGGFGADSLYGGAGSDLIHGGATDNDYIEAGADGDTVDAGYGDDTVHGDDAGDSNTGGIDTLKGGGGKDTIHGGGAIDYIYGDFDSTDSTDNDPDKYTPGANNDLLYGDSGSDWIYGGGGNDLIDGGNETGAYEGDILNGGDGNDEIYGRSGDDLLDGGSGVDTMDGGDGNDSFYVDSAADQAQEDANEGTDYVYSTSYNYTLMGNIEYLILLDNSAARRGFGSSGNDYLNGNGYRNLLEGNGGSDFLYGYGGDDVLKGGAGHDYLVGGNGNDTFYIDASDIHHGYASISELVGQGTHDVVYTTASFELAADQQIEEIFLQTGAMDFTGNKYGNRIVGNSSANRILGASGNDTIAGNGGIDALYGGNDRDFLYGEAANDVLDGGMHDDELTGGAGRDRLTGGSGADTFVFDSASESGKLKSSADMIVDFRSGDDIDLSNLAGRLGWVGSGAFSGRAAEVGFQRVSGGLLVRVDSDGNGSIDMAIFCSGLTQIAKGDFDL